MKGRYKVLLAVLSLILMTGCMGCGKKAILDDENSPGAVTAEIFSQNAGKEDSQQVRVLVYFDKDVQMNEKKQDTIKITIAGKRYDKDKYHMELSQDNKKLVITIPTTAVTNGKIVIDKADDCEHMELFTDLSGKYAAKDFKVEGIIPCGVILEDVKDEEGRVLPGQVRVASQFSIRSIGWLQLIDNGEVVESTQVPKSEKMGNAVAVHGHEFLKDGQVQVAENMAGVINSYFGDRYKAETQDEIIKIQRLENPEAAKIELKFYSYLKLDGKEQKSNADVKESAKMEIDRKMTEEEKKQVEALHLSHKGDQASPYGSGDILYQTFRLTGDEIGEEQNYSLLTLETIYKDAYRNQKFYDVGLNGELKKVKAEDGSVHDWAGIDFWKFMKLCGNDTDAKELYVKYTWNDGKEEVKALEEIVPTEKALLAFVKDGEPLMYSDDDTVLTLVCEDGKEIRGLKEMIVSKEKDPKDPHYTYHHLRKGYDKSNDISFELNIIKGEETVKTAVITTKELEQLAAKHPEAVRRGYYGVSGDRNCFATMGAGGWLDYFEGVDLYWLIQNQLGECEDGARLEFFDRDQKLYTQVDNIDYLKSESPKEYYVLDRDGTEVHGAVPMIAYGKNGYPVLAKHDHESKEYVAFNKMNKNLAAKGVVTEEGVVKNHNGPFIAGLGNRDGMYGGYQKETGGDCVKINIVYP